MAIEEILNVLNNAKYNMNWMWENLHKEHNSDHFNIPANAIYEVEQLIEKITNEKTPNPTPIN